MSHDTKCDFSTTEIFVKTNENDYVFVHENQN